LWRLRGYRLHQCAICRQRMKYDDCWRVTAVRPDDDRIVWFWACSQHRDKDA
jgi:hypothetical protein